VTLIELLIVLSIIIMVTAAAIPIMAPALQNRRMREASRLVSTYISGARARAIETGRPVGVMFERFNGQPFSMVLSYVDVPQPYSGDFSNSRVIVSPGATYGQITGFALTDMLWQGLVRHGDLIRLDSKGPWYAMGAASTQSGQPLPPPTTASPWIFITTSGAAPNLPPSYSAGLAVPFQILRQPIRSSSPPMQLPEGVVIDLSSSSAGTFAFNSGTPMAPIVAYNPWFTFSPGGAMDSVGVPAVRRPTGSVFLLIGRRDLMPDVAINAMNGMPENKNIHDTDPIPKSEYLKNFWIAIAPQTGRVTVAESAVSASNLDIAGASAFAQQGQSVGGR
jgi:type II secretory pathway pseudopilin PulG